MSYMTLFNYPYILTYTCIIKIIININDNSKGRIKMKNVFIVFDIVQVVNGDETTMTSWVVI